MSPGGPELVGDPTGRLLGYAAYAGVLLLFPVFVLYHYSVASGWSPAFAGGLFRVSAVLMAVFGLAHIAISAPGWKHRAPLLELGFIALVSYLVLWTFAAVALGGHRSYTDAALTEALATVAIWLAAYFIGVRVRLREGRDWRLLSLLAATIAACFVHAVAVHGSFVGPFLTFQGDAGLVDAGTTYQGIGRAILVVAVVMSVLRTGFLTQLSVLGAAAVALMALGSRAHLFAILLLMALHILVFGFRRRNLLAGVLALLAAVGAGLAAWEIFLDTRAAEIFELATSTSWQERLFASDEAVRVIREDPFLGAFGYHWADRSAGYAHNLLSAWAGFGGIAFALFVGMMVYAFAVSAARVLLAEWPSAAWRMAFQFNAVALLLAIASEPIYASVFPALGWGFTVAALRRERARHLTLAELTQHWRAAAPQLGGN
ncbi:MAG: O-antigen ligase family protein [Steroidobacteraceae bacterium]